MMTGPSEEAFVRERARRAENSELEETRNRAFARETAVIAALFCMIGVLALCICVVGGFDLQLTGGAYEYSSQPGAWIARRPLRDLTPLFVGLSAAGFAACLVVCGGSLSLLRGTTAAAQYTVALSGAASALGLVFLALNG
ncbi:MAG: hypothetical protein IT463_10635 [Planctomycetes bacterium]|nr:hypothetical protein [Planctomycetota bacterium]